MAAIRRFWISFFALLISKSYAQTNCATYTIAGISGGFSNKRLVDFSSTTSADDAATFLSANSIDISNYSLEDTPLSRIFTPDNVLLNDGSLELKVSAYSGSGSVQSAEVVTDFTFEYASVRTVLQSSTTAGVVEGNFFYKNDNQETDWEILTTTTLHPSPDVPAGIWATNQATTVGGDNTHVVVPFTFDPSADFHEYRIDWTAESTNFYIDGALKANLTENVPFVSGPWVWNAWSNGDPEWSNGPPTADSITRIRSIEMYTGYTADVTGPTCPVN